MKTSSSLVSRSMALQLVVVLFFCLVWSGLARAQLQSADQRSCLEIATKRGPQYGKLFFKRIEKCAKTNFKNSPPVGFSLQTCFETDTNGLTQKSYNKWLGDIDKACAELPDFGFVDSMTALDSYESEALAAVADAFGPDLDVAFPPSPDGKCVRDVTKRVGLLDKRMTSEVSNCVKKGLRAAAPNTLDNVAEYETCLVDSLTNDPRGKIGKIEVQLGKKLDKCTGGPDLSALFVGYADVCPSYGHVADIEGLKACIPDRMRCRACREMSAASGVVADCDTIDNGAADFTCADADNLAPAADAGPDQETNCIQVVTLDGTGSSDPEGAPISFQWSLTDKPAGSSATLSGATTSMPMFTADRRGSYTAELLVSDGFDVSFPDQVVVTAENRAPEANAGPDQTVSPGDPVTLDGSASSDDDTCDALTFAWELVVVPFGSAATLSSISAEMPTFTADLVGTYIAQLVVNDDALSSPLDSVTVTASNDAPVLDPIGPQSIALGESLALTISASDPNGQAVTLSAGPLPLEANASFDAVTGAFTFTPDAAQVGSVDVTFTASDGGLSDSELVTITVGSGTGTTALSGRLLDTNDFVLGTETPIEGATVSIIDSGISATSDSNGDFTLSSIPSGEQVFDIDTSTAELGPDDATYAGFREGITIIAATDNVISRPFFLPRINDEDEPVLVDPALPTEVTNTALGITLTIPAFSAKNPNGTDYTGPITISEVPEALAPATLPDFLGPAPLITIQPVGVVYDPPASISFANSEGFDPGTIVNFWSLDPGSGKFTTVGRGEVDPTGMTIDQLDGGIRANDWHAFLAVFAQLVDDALAGAEALINLATNCPSGSETAVCSGELSEEHTTAAYRSLETDRSLKFNYRSLSADPQPILDTGVAVPASSDALSLKLDLGGAGASTRFFFDTSAESEGTIITTALQFDAASTSTGIYPARLQLRNHTGANSAGTNLGGSMVIRNERSSSFGAGWSIEGVERLYQSATGDAVVVDEGNGNMVAFARAAPGAFDDALVRSIGDFPQVVLAAEVTGDVHNDVLVMRQSANSGVLRLLTNDGAGGFAVSTPETFGAIPADAKLGDFNGDTNIDIVVVGEAANFDRAFVLLGDGAGGFISQGTLSVPDNVGSSASPSGVAVADFDGDTNLDFVVSNEGGQHLVVFFGDGAGAFPSTLSLPLGGNVYDVAVGDWNDDGDVDLFSALDDSVVIQMGDGAGAFSAAITISSVDDARRLATGDLNEDGRLDVVATGPTVGADDKVTVFINNGLAGLSNSKGFWSSVVLTPSGANPEEVELADIDLDGHLDIAMITSNSIVSILFGDGSGSFTRSSFLTTTADAHDLCLADVSNDGALDVIAPHEGSFGPGTIEILYNSSGTGPFIATNGDFSTLTDTGGGTFTRRLKDGTESNFDANGRLTAVVDRNLNTTTFQYDGAGLLEKIIDPAPALLETTFTYVGGLLTTVLDPAGRTTSFEHDGEGNLTKIIDPDLSERSFDYDYRHRLIRQTDKRGFDTTYEFNFAGRNIRANRADGTDREVSPGATVALPDIASGIGTSGNPAPPVLAADVTASFTDGNDKTTVFRTDAFGAATERTDDLMRITQTIRDKNGQITQIVNPRVYATDLTYDAQGNVLSITEAVGTPIERSRSFEYETVFNRVTKITDAALKDTTIIYDAFGNPVKITDPLLGERNLTYNGQGLVLTSQDENTETTAFTYDGDGNIETITDPVLNVTRFVRDTAGNIEQVIEGELTPEERTTVTTYDAMNRPLTVTDGSGVTTTFRYDPAGNLDETELGTGEITSRDYDELGRVLEIQDPLTGTTSFAYDDNGNLVGVLDALLEATLFEYDAANQLVKSVDALLGEQIFTYDDNGNVETFTDARAQTTTFMYDELDRQITRENDLVQQWQFDYDSRDNLIQTTDPRSQVLTRIYDDLSRLTDVNTPDNTIDYTYDPAGNLEQAEDSDSRAIFTYDGNNRVLTATTVDLGAQAAVVLTNTYDAVGNRDSLADSLGGSATYDYDGAGRLAQLITASSQQIDLTYDNAGRPDLIQFPNGTTADHDYDPTGRLMALAHDDGVTDLAVFGYSYDPAGNIAAIAELADTKSYTYDELQRLVTGGTGAAPESYDYDAVGNRTASHLSAAHGHNGANRLNSDDGYTYTYDLNGNLATKTDKAPPFDVTTYSWDAQNQLIQIDRPDTTVVTYAYDALGRRIEKDVDSTVTRYVYDGEDIALEFGRVLMVDTLQKRYSHGDRVDQPLSVEDVIAGEDYFYHADHLGSVRLLTDDTGAVANSYEYDGYGRVIAITETQPQPYAFTGRERDGESGLYYYRARYYDPVAGRFVSEDPIGFESGETNLYRYGKSSPLLYTDPTGEILFTPAIVGAGVAGGINLASQLLSNGGRLGCVDLGALAISALSGAAISTLAPTGALLGRGGTRAAAQGFGSIRGLLNRGQVRFGWSFNASTKLNVLSARIGRYHRDLAGIGVRGGARPIRDGVISGAAGGGPTSLPDILSERLR